jgi:hypothetical protein
VRLALPKIVHRRRGPSAARPSAARPSGRRGLARASVLDRAGSALLVTACLHFGDFGDPERGARAFDPINSRRTIRRPAEKFARFNCISLYQIAGRPGGCLPAGPPRRERRKNIVISLVFYWKVRTKIVHD